MSVKTRDMRQPGPSISTSKGGIGHPGEDTQKKKSIRKLSPYSHAATEKWSGSGPSPPAPAKAESLHGDPDYAVNKDEPPDTGGAQPEPAESTRSERIGQGPKGLRETPQNDHQQTASLDEWDVGED